MGKESLALIVTGILFLALPFGGCARSRADAIRDHAATVEQRLETERDSVLASGHTPRDKDLRLSHLQSLRTGLSVARVSLASVPLLLTEDAHREIGYSVLDEAIGTINWNIPIYPQSAGVPRDFPTLFSPTSGLNFGAIRAGQSGTSTIVPPPGIAR